MRIPPAFRYKGDILKAVKLKAQALQFYNFSVNQLEIGGVSFASKKLPLEDGSLISIVIRKEGIYQAITGVITIFGNTVKAISKVAAKAYPTFFISSGNRRVYDKSADLDTGFSVLNDTYDYFSGAGYHTTGGYWNSTNNNIYPFINKTANDSGSWTNGSDKTLRWDRAGNVYLNKNAIVFTISSYVYLGVLSVSYVLTKKNELIGFFYNTSTSTLILKNFGVINSTRMVNYSSFPVLTTVTDVIYDFELPISFLGNGRTAYIGESALTGTSVFTTFSSDFTTYTHFSVPETSLVPYSSGEGWFVHATPKGFVFLNRTITSSATNPYVVGTGAIKYIEPVYNNLGEITAVTTITKPLPTAYWNNPSPGVAALDVYTLYFYNPDLDCYLYRKNTWISPASSVFITYDIDAKIIYNKSGVETVLYDRLITYPTVQAEWDNLIMGTWSDKYAPTSTVFGTTLSLTKGAMPCFRQYFAFTFIQDLQTGLYTFSTDLSLSLITSAGIAVI